MCCPFIIQTLANLPEFYATANTENKQKIIGSIFKGTFIYENQAYRTIELNEVVKLISLKTKCLETKKPELQAHLLKDSRLIVRSRARRTVLIQWVNARVSQEPACLLFISAGKPALWSPEQRNEKSQALGFGSSP